MLAAQLLHQARRHRDPRTGSYPSITWTDRTSQGSIQHFGGHITSPWPSTRRRLQTLAHEIGHQQCHFEPDRNGGWNITADALKKPEHHQEYEAEIFAQNWLKWNGVELHRREFDIGKRVVHRAIKADLLRHRLAGGVPATAPAIDADIARWVGLSPFDIFLDWLEFCGVDAALRSELPGWLFDYCGLANLPELEPNALPPNVVRQLREADIAPTAATPGEGLIFVYHTVLMHRHKPELLTGDGQRGGIASTIRVRAPRRSARKPKPELLASAWTWAKRRIWSFVKWLSR